MPTESYGKLLDRELAVANVRELSALTSPLLQELVNHGTHALARCQLGATGEEGVDLAAFILYRQVTELTDAVEVLLANSCVLATIPLLRSSLEATLGLEYLLSGDSTEFRSRSLSWLCVAIHRRLERYDLLEPDRQVPKKGHAQQMPRSVAAGEAKANLAEALEPSYMEPVEQEYQRLSQHRKPPWYSLFGGPRNLRELARRLAREKEYTHLYKHWSTYSHGDDATSGFTKAPRGEGVAFKGLRSPERLVSLTDLAAHFQLKATRLMIAKFRVGESLERWYLEEVQPRQEALRSINVEVETVEWE